MLRLRTILIVLALAFALAPLHPREASATAPVLYAATGAGVPNGQGCGGTLSTLYTLDPTTAAETLVGPIKVGSTQVRHVTGLGVDPVTGTLYGFMNGQDTSTNCTDFAQGTLIAIDKATGAATIVGAQGDVPIQSPDMTFDPLGRLYAWSVCEGGDCSHNALWTLDTSTGTGTKVGECGCSYDTRVGISADSKGRLFVKADNLLQRLDRTTSTLVGAPLSLTPNVQYHNMLAFGPSDVLYTGTRSNTGLALKTIDQSTGAVITIASNNVPNISALAWDFGTPSGTADLSLTKTVDENAPDPETNVTFTVTLSNAGPDTATGVQVKDLLPNGFTYVSDDSGGDYDSGTGLWDAGSIASGNASALEITATYHSSGSHTNIAEVVEETSFDPDSIPGSGEGDTFSSVSLIPTLFAATGAGVPNGQGCAGTLSSLYAIDPSTGGATKIADIRVDGRQVRDVTGLAVHPVTGVLYGFMNGQDTSIDCTDFYEGTLITIDKATGAATIVGEQGDVPIHSPDMTFDPLGTPYAWSVCDPDCSHNALWTLDTSTGTGTKVGECGCTYDSRVGISADSKRRLFVKADNLLQRVDRSTGALLGSPLSLTPSGTASSTYHNMLAFGPSGVLYTGTRSNTGFTLKTINQSTGAVTAVGSPNNITNISALAWDFGTPSGIADLSLTKTVNLSNPSPETPVTFTITVSNAGPDTATGVVVKDLLPSGFTHVIDNGGGAYNAGTGIWTVGSITNGNSAALQIQATYHSSGQHTNVAEVVESDQFDPDSIPGSGEGDTYSAVPLPPTLYAVTGAGAGQSSCNGTPSTLYTLDALTGAATRVADIKIGATQIRHVTGLAIDPTSGILYGFMNGQIAQPDCTDFAKGTLITIDKSTGVATVVGTQGAADIQSPDMAFDPFGTLYAWSEASHCDPGFFNNCSDEDDLFTINKTTGVGSQVGECNCGTSGTGLAVDSRGRMFVKPGSSLDVVNQFTGHIAPWSSLPTSADNMLAFGPSDVPYTGRRSATGFTLKTFDRDTGTVTDVGSNEVRFIGALAWDLGTYTPPGVADLSITKTVDDDAPADFTDVTFTITVANGGPDTATGVEVYDPVPSGFTYASDDGGGAYDHVTGIWTVGSIANGNSAVLHVTMHVKPHGGHTNVAELLDSDTYDPDSVPATGEGEAIASQSVEPSASLDPNVDAHADVILKGGTLASDPAKKFTVVVTNAGEAVLPLSVGDIEVTVNDDGSVVTCKPFSPTTLKSGSSKKMSCTANIANLFRNPGDDVTFRATVDIPSDGFAANDTDSVFRTLGSDTFTPPGTTDAHADVLVKGGTLASNTKQKFTVTVINAGQDPLPLSFGDVDVTVNDNGGVVTCKPFSPTTVKSGSSKKMNCTANIANLFLNPGDDVTYRAVVDVTSDSRPDNNTDSVFRTLT